MNRKKRKVEIFKGDGSPICTAKINRNDKCFCGSGKKQKHCHGMVPEYYSSKPK